MNYYWLAVDSASEIGVVQECVDTYTLLPHVFNPICGHIRRWDGASIPAEADALGAVAPWVGTSRRPRTVSEDVWSEIDASLNTLFESAGSGTPWIYPGLRLGCAVVRVDDTSWHYSQRGSAELYSEELIECFRGEGVALPLIQEAVIHSGSPIKRKYFELVPTQLVKIRDEDLLRWKVCPECGMTQELEYRQLMPALRVGESPDFIRVSPTFSTLVSERVKEVVERLAENVLAIPASKISIGRGAVSISELLSQARFDQQLARRSFG